MDELPDWDEVYDRLLAASPRIADVVWNGLGHPRDDTDKRLVMEIVERLERRKEERRH